ncbi:ATP-dependent DNA helicase pif1-like [Montipora foliosa]|uniref:ATP-dependent DNA helicase pif1-like n=1 Tax=Montipora foliosa TaxID=591990 RepID=UPI0035F168C1
MKHWLYSSLDAEWHWYRFEYQARGSIHCHGVAKLKNDPGLCQLSETALRGYLAEMSIDKAEQTDILELNEQIVEGKKASQAVCEYVDWLLSTYNPNPPDKGSWIKPSIHPCQRQHKDIVNMQQSDDDYVDLLNMLLRYKPWQATQENAWDNQPGSDKIYITSWKAFVQTKYAKQHVPDWFEKLQTLQNLSENDTDSEDFSEQLPQHEDWMHLADLIPGSFVNTTEQIPQSDYNYDWQNDKCKTSCAVTATTGKAAYNINGCTIHSLLKLPVGTRGNKELTAQALVRLQNNLKGIAYIIIDEYSMLGQTMLGWIDRCCRQATGISDEVFGHLSIILFGDPAQLPPVADKPLYHSKPISSLVEFQDATRLYFSNEEVANYNVEKKLSALQHPIACVNARHSSDLAKKASPDEMAGLEPCIFLAKGAHVMLTMNLWTAVGLCNGATATVIDSIYTVNQQPPTLPEAVIVKFDNYIGPSISESIPSCVPICPITVSSQTLDGLHERQQLPLKLAWAITIHKSQGLTLPKAWIDIGQTERTAGISYVAISRVRTLPSCIIQPMTFERLKSIKKSATLNFRIEEEKRLNELAEQTCQIK